MSGIKSPSVKYTADLYFMRPKQQTHCNTSTSHKRKPQSSMSKPCASTDMNARVSAPRCA